MKLFRVFSIAVAILIPVAAFASPPGGVKCLMDECGETCPRTGPCPECPCAH